MLYMSQSLSLFDVLSVNGAILYQLLKVKGLNYIS